NWAERVLRKAKLLNKANKLQAKGPKNATTKATATTRSVFAAEFKAALNFKNGHTVTAVHLKNAIFTQIGRRSSTTTIANKVTKLIPWLKTRHALVVTLLKPNIWQVK
ncbi:MAG TPA: hypothetical protein VNX68_19025, partial [Nitrosopumilaceae archaeon]|nr:hypothetical protein [Nitrosopumilaceae archaeon]